MEHKKGQAWNIDYPSKNSEVRKKAEDVLCSDTPGDKGFCINFARKGNVAGLATMSAACNPKEIVWSYIIKHSALNTAEVIC